MKKKSIVIGSLSMISGAVLGMLFAPKKGKELREDIKDVTKDVKEKGVKKTLKEELKMIECEVEKLTDEKMKPVLKEKTTEILEKLEDILKRARKEKDKIIEKSANVLKDKVNDLVK